MQSLAFLGRVGEAKAGGHALPVVCDLLFAGIWDKHPDLKIVLVESNIGWIPTLLEQTDDMFLRYRFFTKATEQMDQMPSRIFHRQFWATFMIDTVGMDLRHRLNVDHMMWSTDYPHTGCDWPNSRVVIETGPTRRAEGPGEKDAPHEYKAALWPGRLVCCRRAQRREGSTV